MITGISDDQSYSDPINIFGLFFGQSYTHKPGVLRIPSITLNKIPYSEKLYLYTIISSISYALSYKISSINAKCAGKK